MWNGENFFPNLTFKHLNDNCLCWRHIRTVSWRSRVRVPVWPDVFLALLYLSLNNARIPYIYFFQQIYEIFFTNEKLKKYLKSECFRLARSGCSKYVKKKCWSIMNINTLSSFTYITSGCVQVDIIYFIENTHQM